MAACVSLALASQAQTGTLKQRGLPYAESPDELSSLLWERDKELMHTSVPIGLSGLDQSDDGFRADTPALKRTDRAIALVDADENYRRRLAMYEQGERFDAAPRVVAHAVLQTPRSSSAGSSALTEDSGQDNEGESSSSFRTLCLGGLAVGLGWLLTKIRSGGF